MVSAYKPVNVKSFFRYPGGKDRLKSPIIDALLRRADVAEYREPFVGGGSIALTLAQRWNGGTYWLNDADPGTAAIWWAVINRPREFRRRIMSATPSLEQFDRFRLRLRHQTGGRLALATMKIAVHQWSYSGLGEMGGPLGGRVQRTYRIDDRWNPVRICDQIEGCHALLGGVHARCTCTDFVALFARNVPALLYLDPPYYHKGNECYRYGFTKDDHRRLCEWLRATPHRWVLTYDDCPEVRRMYSWAHIRKLSVHYSIAGSVEQSELLITAN